MKSRKKLNLAVKQQFQKWMLLRVFGAVLLSAVLAALILYIYGRLELIDSFEMAHFKIRRLSDLLLPVVLAGTLVSLFSGVLLAVFLPQKIAGPLYRIEKGMQDIQKGDFSVTIQIRENDPLQDLVQSINGALEAFRARSIAPPTEEIQE